jgi:hypothetical protein
MRRLDRIVLARAATLAACAFVLPTAAVPAQAPNDACANAFEVDAGSYPKTGPDGVHFTTEGATPSVALIDEPPLTGDVWFDYAAATSGRVVVVVDPTVPAPNLKPSTFFVAVHETCGGGALGSAVGGGDAPEPAALLEFDATAGLSYRIRVATFGDGAAGGSFALTLAPRFRLALSSPAGPGSLRAEIRDGAPFHVVFLCATLDVGCFPNGAFFGIDPAPTEIAAQLAFGGPPFLASLDAFGGFLFAAPPGTLPPTTLYATALQFDASSAFAGATDPVSLVAL